MELKKIINSNYLIESQLPLVASFIKLNPDTAIDVCGVKLTSMKVRTRMREWARTTLFIDTDNSYMNLLFKTIKDINDFEGDIADDDLESVYNCPKNFDIKRLLEIIKIVSNADATMIPSENSKLNVLYIAACYLVSKNVGFKYNIIVIKALRKIYTLWKDEFNLEGADKFQQYFMINTRLTQEYENGKFKSYDGSSMSLEEVEAIPATQEALITTDAVFNKILHLVMNELNEEYKLSLIKLNSKRDPRDFKSLLEADL